MQVKQFVIDESGEENFAPYNERCTKKLVWFSLQLAKSIFNPNLVGACLHCAYAFCYEDLEFFFHLFTAKTVEELSFIENSNFKMFARVKNLSDKENPLIERGSNFLDIILNSFAIKDKLSKQSFRGIDLSPDKSICYLEQLFIEHNINDDSHKRMLFMAQVILNKIGKNTNELCKLLLDYVKILQIDNPEKFKEICNLTNILLLGGFEVGAPITPAIINAYLSYCEIFEKKNHVETYLRTMPNRFDETRLKKVLGEKLENENIFHFFNFLTNNPNDESAIVPEFVEMANTQPESISIENPIEINENSKMYPQHVINKTPTIEIVDNDNYRDKIIRDYLEACEISKTLCKNYCQLSFFNRTFNKRCIKRCPDIFSLVEMVSLVEMGQHSDEYNSIYQEMLQHKSDVTTWIIERSYQASSQDLIIMKEIFDNIKTRMEIIRDNNLYDNLVKSHKRTKKRWWPFGGKRMKTKRKKMKNTRKRIRKT